VNDVDSSRDDSGMVDGLISSEEVESSMELETDTELVAVSSTEETDVQDVDDMTDVVSISVLVVVSESVIEAEEDSNCADDDIIVLSSGNNFSVSVLDVVTVSQSVVEEIDRSEDETEVFSFSVLAILSDSVIETSDVSDCADDEIDVVSNSVIVSEYIIEADEDSACADAETEVVSVSVPVIVFFSGDDVSISVSEIVASVSINVSPIRFVEFSSSILSSDNSDAEIGPREIGEEGNKFDDWRSAETIIRAF
jgi:hypothetical protein